MVNELLYYKSCISAIEDILYEYDLFIEGSDYNKSKTVQKIENQIKILKRKLNKKPKEVNQTQLKEHGVTYDIYK